MGEGGVGGGGALSLRNTCARLTERLCTLCANVDDVPSQESRCVSGRLDRAEESRQQTRGSSSTVSRSDFGSEFEQYCHESTAFARLVFVRCLKRIGC